MISRSGTSIYVESKGYESPSLEMECEYLALEEDQRGTKEVSGFLQALVFEAVDRAPRVLRGELAL